jgi:hypothetical protein
LLVKGTKAIDSRQIFMIVTIVEALSAAMIATPVMAQNMTGGNMTGGNKTGGKMTGGNMTGKISGGGIMGLVAEGSQDIYPTGNPRIFPTPPIGGLGQSVPTDPGDVEGQSEDEDQDEDGGGGGDDEEQEGGN